MNLKECIKGSIQQLLSSKMRTFLTMLGMFIGIGSVIMVLSIGEGVRGYVMSVFDDLGTGVVEIGVRDKEREYLMTSEDLEIIRENEAVEDIIFMTNPYITSVENYKEESSIMMATGVPYNIDSVYPLKITAGRAISENEDKAKAQVMMVSDTYAKVVLGVDDPEMALGQKAEITINGQTAEYDIIGLVEAEVFPGMPVEMMPLMAYIPFSSLDQMAGSGDGRSDLAIMLVAEGYNPNEVGYQVTRLLDKRHATEDNYRYQSMMSMMDQIDSVLALLTGFIGLVAGISLVVGGIGIMNIMLVTVKERTREIGIRKSVGATNKQILRQFLIEALILTVIGGIIGMLLGYLGGVIAGNIANIAVELTVEMLIFSVGTSSAIGIIFGVYPAYQASKLDPVESLRYE